MRLVHQDVFSTIVLGPEDTLRVRFNYKGIKREAMVEKPDEVRFINCLRVYVAEEFEGMNGAYVVALGYVPPETLNED